MIVGGSQSDQMFRLGSTWQLDAWLVPLYWLELACQGDGLDGEFSARYTTSIPPNSPAQVGAMEKNSDKMVNRATMIQDLPVDEKPREHLRALGASQLATWRLLLPCSGQALRARTC
ncbi:MAG: hypothetical protein CL709_09610 [Chloroflexi bacterium]|nr:hypothetical protein [Chloroflexota bacterium]